MEKKEKLWKCGLVLLSMLLVFLGVYVFTQMTTNEAAYSACVYLLFTITAVACTGFVCCEVLQLWVSDFTAERKVVLDIVICIAVALITYTVVLDFDTYGDGWQRLLYDALNMIIFPILLLCISKMKQSKKDKIASAIAIVLFDVSMTVFFGQWGHNWMRDIAMIHVIVLWATPNLMDDAKKYRKQRCALLGVYGICWTIVLGIVRYWDFGFGYFAWIQQKEYFIHFLSKVKVVGLAELKGGSFYLKEYFLCNNCNPIHTLLYYGGWVTTGIYVLFLVVFLGIMYRCLGKKYKQYKEFYGVYVACFVHLLLRVIFGFMDSLFIAQCDTSLPFVGNGYIFDSVATVLLFVSYCENQFIEEHKLFNEYTQKRLVDCFKQGENGEFYQVEESMDAEENYVHCIKNQNNEILICKPWIDVKRGSRTFIVYELEETEFLMVEFTDEHTIKDVDDNELFEDVIKKGNVKYMKYYLWDNSMFDALEEEFDDEEEE